MSTLFSRMNASIVIFVLANALLVAACGESAPNSATRTASSGENAAAPRYVFLVSLDTVGAQYCSVYGYEKPTTPFLEQLGEKGAVFERHVVNSNNTLVSHSSIMTGMLPAAHDTYDGGANNRHRLADEYVTLAERFQEAGYATAGFATHGLWLTKKFGIGQGFDHFQSAWINAPENGKAFLSWLDKEQPERAFVFLHFFDAHSDGSGPGDEPYLAGQKFLKEFAGERPADYTSSVTDKDGTVLYGSKALKLLSQKHRVIPEAHLAYLQGTYDAGLANLDRYLSHLFSNLADRGILDESLIVITSDHGEEFKQHARLLHTQYFDEVMRVPLIFKLPNGQVPARQRISDLTRSIDLAPTILELAGLDAIPLAQGRSFASTLLSGTEIPFADTMLEGGVLLARDENGEYKFVWGKEKSQLYDLAVDPDEQNNIYKDVSEARQLKAKERLDELTQESLAVKDAVAASRASEPEMSAEDLEELQGLGYLGDDE